MKYFDNCTWNWKAAGNTDYGLAGYEVVGTNGNKIFIPCTGYWYSSTLAGKNTSGYYWTNTFVKVSSGDARTLVLYSGSYYIGDDTGGVHCGQPIRPVQ